MSSADVRVPEVGDVGPRLIPSTSMVSEFDETGDDAVSTYGRLQDDFFERRDEARVELATGRVSFSFSIDSRALTRSLDDEQALVSHDGEQIQAYQERVLEAFGPVAKQHGLTLAVEPYGGPKTGGPIPDQQQLVTVVGIALEWVGHIVNLAALYVLLRDVRNKAKEVTANDILVDEGFAIIAVSDAVLKATGDNDLVLSFSAVSGTYTPARGDFDPTHDGWMLGFRGPQALYLAHVDIYGNVNLIREPIPVDW
jgi:hypothetical protein